ncbi:MAG TPA: hypothetical protein VN631_04845, partial [Negativicutes bacterium]|nr:hypothetical protein [Negativicutes bacterium]
NVIGPGDLVAVMISCINATHSTCQLNVSHANAYSHGIIPRSSAAIYNVIFTTPTYRSYRTTGETFC